MIGGCMTQLLKVHSIESLGALDGPGLRMVIFLTGCPLRCSYCHNPDTWTHDNAQQYDSDTLLKKILRMKPYFQNFGGVTFSGGDPLVQAAALLPLVEDLKKEGIHVALDTSGELWNKDIEALVEKVDLVLLDFKHTDESMYKRLTNGNLKNTQHFLDKLIEHQTNYWIRQVIISDINDTEDQVICLEEITRSPYREKIELLPYHKKALHKWEALGINCPLEEKPETSKHDLEYLFNKIIVNS